MLEKTGANILVVDDDAFVLESLSALLQEYGYRVTASGSAENALGKFREASPDVVLTDIRIPGVSGVELLEKIHTLNPDVPVIHHLRPVRRTHEQAAI